MAFRVNFQYDEIKQTAIVTADTEDDAKELILENYPSASTISVRPVRNNSICFPVYDMNSNVYTISEIVCY